MTASLSRFLAIIQLLLASSAGSIHDATLPTGSKKQVDGSVLSACLVAKGTGIDIDKMKDISDVKEHDLKSTYADFIRHMTLTQASDVVMNRLKKIPIFEKYTLTDYGIHTSIDGQKLETKFNSLIIRSKTSLYFRN
ncbi:Tn3 family transposase [Legionella feeleii]|uniref:Transposase Tn3 family protein n=1 Tax=Legionella feeleii TaxID=453 RepID=A0A378IU94_9GAMM|nr:Tn3 family transposase [Legionella feeleii]STX38786.1 Transposase Tn3 family protein [Legionella feeleii]